LGHWKGGKTGMFPRELWKEINKNLR
jgi:hypothetical protein